MNRKNPVTTISAQVDVCILYGAYLALEKMGKRPDNKSQVIKYALEIIADKWKNVNVDDAKMGIGKKLMRSDIRTTVDDFDSAYNQLGRPNLGKELSRKVEDLTEYTPERFFIAEITKKNGRKNLMRVFSNKKALVHFVKTMGEDICSGYLHMCLTSFVQEGHFRDWVDQIESDMKQ